MVSELMHTRAFVKGILEENFAVRRTLDFYACKMFSARQEKYESVASWGSRIDEMQTELREAARRICKPEGILGALGLICHLGKACFGQGLMSGFKPLFAVEASQSCYHRLWKLLWRKGPFFPLEKNSRLQGTPSGVQFAIG